MTNFAFVAGPDAVTRLLVTFQLNSGPVRRAVWAERADVLAIRFLVVQHVRLYMRDVLEDFSASHAGRRIVNVDISDVLLHCAASGARLAAEVAREDGCWWSAVGKVGGEVGLMELAVELTCGSVGRGL